MKKIFKVFLDIAHFILMLIGCFIYYHFANLNWERHKPISSEEYFKEFNYSFSGRVIYAERFFPEHVGFVGLKLTQTDINFYDVRDSSDNYFCVIRNDTAEVFIRKMYDVEVGDVFKFDGEMDEISIYNIYRDSLKANWQADIQDGIMQQMYFFRHKLR